MKKRIAALFIALLAAIAFSQPQTGGFGTGGNAGRLGPSFSNLAFFEFAPASGQGMTAACACTTPTGAKGETMTFTRTGNATCSKQGLATTGIANGDLVVCTADQPRVEASGGVLGLRVEGARTNSVLRSQELDNAAWVDDSSPIAAITITANAATAPDGTLTAERFEIPARTGLQYSLRRQAIAAGSTGNASIYVKGNGTSGSISLATDSPLLTATDCAYVDATWTRCVLGTIGTWFFVGSITGYGSSSGTKAAQDVFVWGAQTEGSGVATHATSYIPTVAAAVTRNAESPYLTMPVTLSPRSIAVTAQVPYSTIGTNARLMGVRVNASDLDRFELFFPAAASVTSYLETSSGVGAGQSVANGGVTLPGSVRGAGWHIPNTTLAAIGNGAQNTAATTLLAPPSTYNRVYIGVYAPLAGFEADGIITRVCVDPDSARCR